MQTISEYIMEEEISGASVDAIEIAQLYSEMCVLSAMMDIEEKANMICEFATGDVGEFDIFQEGDESKDKDNQSVLGQIGDVIKGHFRRDKKAAKKKAVNSATPTGADADPADPADPVDTETVPEATIAIVDQKAEAPAEKATLPTASGTTVTDNWFKKVIAFCKRIVVAMYRKIQNCKMKKTIKMLEKMKETNPEGTVKVDVDFLNSFNEILQAANDLFAALTGKEGIEEITPDKKKLDLSETIAPVLAAIRNIKTDVKKKKGDTPTQKDATYDELIDIYTKISENAVRAKIKDTKSSLKEHCNLDDKSIKLVKQAITALNNKYADLPLANLALTERKLIKDANKTLKDNPKAAAEVSSTADAPAAEPAGAPAEDAKEEVKAESAIEDIPEDESFDWIGA
jgi:hypothetical protein